MPAGKLNRRIVIRQLQTGQDAIGQPSTTWFDVATIWADVRFVSGIETIKAGRETSTGRASVRIRNMSGITAQMRALIDGSDYNIVDVVPDHGRAWLTLICESVQ